MNISSISSTSLQQAMDQMHKSSNEMVQNQISSNSEVSSSEETQKSLVESTAELKESEILTEANTKVVSAADQTLGSLIDTWA